MSPIPAITPRAGARPGLVCLHCSGSSGRQWAPYRQALDHLDVATPDLLGYGADAAWPPGRPVTLDDEAHHLRPLLESPSGGVHLFGHSYGGAVALQIALRWPQRVASLTLYEPVRFALLFGDLLTEPLGRDIVAVGRHIGTQVLAGRPADAAALFTDYWSGGGTWAALAPARQQALAARMPKVREEFEALFGDAVPRADYRRLAMPVRLLAGTRSPLPARRVVDVLARLLPHAEKRVLPGLGHLGPVTDAHRVLAALPPMLAPLTAPAEAPAPRQVTRVALLAAG